MLTVRRSICMGCLLCGGGSAGGEKASLRARGGSGACAHRADSSPTRGRRCRRFVRASALGGLHALHGAKLVKLRTRHHHLNEQLGLAHGELELHHAVVMLLHDADETLRHIPGGRGCGVGEVAAGSCPGAMHGLCQCGTQVAKISIIFGLTLKRMATRCQLEIAPPGKPAPILLCSIIISCIAMDANVTKW